jgi:hypothetical protein
MMVVLRRIFAEIVGGQLAFTPRAVEGMAQQIKARYTRIQFLNKSSHFPHP